MSKNYCLSNREAINNLITYIIYGAHVQSLDLVYDHVDELCVLQKFTEANEFGKLLLSDCSSATASVFLSYITVTFPWKNELPDRIDFINKIREDHKSILEFLDRMN
jgi:hypothetical protein